MQLPYLFKLHQGLLEDRSILVMKFADYEDRYPFNSIMFDHICVVKIFEIHHPHYLKAWNFNDQSVWLSRKCVFIAKKIVKRLLEFHIFISLSNYRMITKCTYLYSVRFKLTKEKNKLKQNLSVLN